MDAILTYDLCKHYKDSDRSALHMLNLQVQTGQMLAIVGSANSGKSTALRLFAGLSTPSSGECTVMGYSPQYELQRVHAITGVVLENARLYENMTLQENLQFFAKLNRLDGYDAVDRISFLLHKLDIWSMRDTQVGSLPTSGKQRANYARALLHRPRLVLLDEPTNSMDRETTDLVKALVEHLVQEEEATVVVGTRHLAHAQKICNSFAILRDGVLQAKGNLDTLRKRFGLSYQAVFQIAENTPVPQGFLRLGDSFTKKIQTEKEMPALLKMLIQSGCNVFDAKIVKPSLSDVYAAMEANNPEEGDQYAEYENEGTGTEPETYPNRQTEPAEGAAGYDAGNFEYQSGRQHGQESEAAFGEENATVVGRGASADLS